VILTYGPYGKGLAFQEGYPDQWRRMSEQHPDVLEGSTKKYQNWEVPDPEKWVPRGYACVRVDSRGAGCSPGIIDPRSPREARDLYLCIEWAGTQPWSNGKVGLLGISYYARNQWTVASLQPPHLAAILPWEGASDSYRDGAYHGGILCTFSTNWFKKQVITVQHGLGNRGAVNPNTGETVGGPETLSDEELSKNRVDLGKELRAHFLDDEYHRGRSPDWSKVTVPLLTAADWGGQGLHLRGNIEGFVRWPLARTRWTRLYFNPADRSLGWKPVKEKKALTYEALGEGLTFLSPPLEQEMEITGPVASKIFVSSSTADADLFLVLRVFAPDGQEVVFQGALDSHAPIGQGWLRASHRKLDPKLSTPYRPYHTHDKVEPLTPGKIYELDVEIWPTCIVIPAGYRIALSVRGKDYEYAGEGQKLSTFVNVMRGCGPFLHDDPKDRPQEVFGGKVTLHAGADLAAYVLLPVIPAGIGTP
jgi:predicted acyl esterase